MKTAVFCKSCHLPTLTYVSTCAPTVAQFLAHLSPRQVKIAAGYLDGLTQEQLAAKFFVNRRTVIRDLNHVRQVCARFGRAFPEPLRQFAEKQCQLSDDVYRSL